jgi:hypothetical protein
MASTPNSLIFAMKIKDTLRELPIDPRLMYVLERMVEHMEGLERRLDGFEKSEKTGKKPSR